MDEGFKVKLLQGYKMVDPGSFPLYARLQLYYQDI
jgi:hypothetical protein